MFRDVIPHFETKYFWRVTFYANAGSEVATRFRVSTDPSEFNTKQLADVFLRRA